MTKLDRHVGWRVPSPRFEVNGSMVDDKQFGAVGVASSRHSVEGEPPIFIGEIDVAAFSNEQLHCCIIGPYGGDGKRRQVDAQNRSVCVNP